MKSKLMILGLVVLFSVGGYSIVSAGDHDGHDHGQMTSNSAVEVGNTVCPVGGEKVEAGKEVKIEHNGKIYNLCCAMCKKDFKANPEKFSKIAEDSVTK